MKILAIAFTFAGTMIGAGFLSGKEIAVFFGISGVFSVALASLAIAVFCCVFVLLGIYYDGNVENAIFRKYRDVFGYASKTVNFVTFTVMLAGGEYILRELFDLPGGGVITAVCALPFAYGDSRGISILNTLLVPFATASIVYIAVKTQNQIPVGGRLCLVKPILYSSLNLISSGTLAAKMSKGLKPRHAFIAAAVVGVVMFALIMALKTSIIGYEDSDMPLVSLLENTGLRTLSGILIVSAVFSTAVSTLKLCSDGRKKAPVTAAVAGLLISVIGFGKLTTFTYPLISGAGIVYGILAVARLIYTTKNNKLTVSPLQGKANV